MPLNRYARPVESIFSLIGEDEKAITDSLAWVLEQCPIFRRSLLKKLTGLSIPSKGVAIATQTYGVDAGFTDIEISGASALHLVIEAKQGWTLPSEQQLQRYARRLAKNGLPSRLNFLVSASECSTSYARLFLPDKVKGFRVEHISWRDILTICQRSRAQASSFQEKAWLAQFENYLEGIATMQDIQSNKVWVVALSDEEIRKGSGYTWIDVVQKDGCYFHPVGRTYPLSPPNYVGFRYYGRLQSIHYVEKSRVSNHLHKENKRWPNTSHPHFVYDLGPAIRPPLTMGLGNLYSTGRVWCLIDTLLTGEYRTLKEASDASKKRLRRAGLN
jgi:hypothetical protein